MFEGFIGGRERYIGEGDEQPEEPVVGGQELWSTDVMSQAVGLEERLGYSWQRTRVTFC